MHLIYSLIIFAAIRQPLVYSTSVASDPGNKVPIKAIYIEIPNESRPVYKHFSCLTDDVMIWDDDHFCLLVKEKHTFHLAVPQHRIIQFIKFHLSERLSHGKLTVDPPIANTTMSNSSSSVIIFGPLALGSNVSISLSSESSLHLTEIQVFDLEPSDLQQVVSWLTPGYMASIAAIGFALILAIGYFGWLRSKTHSEDMAKNTRLV